MSAEARDVRRLPKWLGGAEVSGATWRLVSVGLCDPLDDSGPTARTTELAFADSDVSVVHVVEVLAERLEVDEADVLRAFAELERVGALSTGRCRREQ